MTAVMNGHAPIGAEVLSRDEAIALSGYETTIERGLNTYIEVGTALGQIREGRLYRALYATFEDYCHGRWGFNRHRASQLIGAIDVVTNVTSEGLPAPANEGQARALGQVPPEQQADVWREVNETPGKVTAEKIRDVADARKPDLAPVILDALTEGGRDGLDLKAIAVCFAEPPVDKDLTRALEKLVKSGEIVVTRTWANGKPRKWASADVAGDLTPDVLRHLRDARADGALAFRVAFLIDNVVRPVDRVTEVLHRLAAAGQVTIVGTVEGGNLWALTELVDAQTPEPAAADAPAVVAGSGTTDQPEPDAERAVAECERVAASLVAEITSMVTTIIDGLDHGASGIPVSLAEIDACRAALDRLEARVIA